MVAVKRERILISACLIGEKVRYDGRAASQPPGLMDQWMQEGRLVKLCPECAAGLPIPRPPAEIRNGYVMTEEGEDQTDIFQQGAELALKLCQTQNIRIALLKENSPSCGSNQIYDGAFRGKLVKGEGMVTKLLRKQGIRVFSENELDQLSELLNRLES